MTINLLSKSNGAICIREFTGENVNFRSNPDLWLQLRMGENTGGTVEDAVLVKLNCDQEDFSEVEVYTGTLRRLDTDTIDAAIEALIVVRDSLLAMTPAA